MGIAKTGMALALVFSLTVSSVAAAPPEGEATRRQEDLDTLYTTMEEHHPDLFFNTPEDVFLARKGEIEAALTQSDDVTFWMDLQTLAVLAGDSHTSLNINQLLQEYDMAPVGIKWMEGRWILTVVEEQHQDLLGWNLTGLNGLTMEEVCQKMSRLLSADNGVKLRRQVGQIFGVEPVFTFCGVSQAGEPMVLSLEGPEGEQRELTVPLMSTTDQDGWPTLVRLSEQREEGGITDYDKNRYYFGQALDEGNYYVQFNVCREDPQLPMADLVNQVSQDLEAGNYERVLLDLRNNGGGSDGVLQPLLRLLAHMVRSGALEVWGLIGETTYSSAGINAMMIKEMGGFLAGEESSGSVDHFGSVGSFALPNSGIRVSMSQKFIVLEEYMECAQGLGITPIQPDWRVVQTVEDYLAGRDTVVEGIVTRTEAFGLPDQPEAPLTRGRFAELLRQAAQEAGQETAAAKSEFWDSFPFAWFTPGVDWAVANGVAGGNGEGQFCPARPITRQEAGVMMARTAQLLGLELEGEATLTDESAIAHWAAPAVHSVVAQGWMKAEEGAFLPLGGMTRAQGEAMAAQLKG